MNTLEKIGKIGIVPVVVIEDPERAVPLARALVQGGLPCAEITFRTAQALESLKRIHAEMPDFLLGAGTVLTPEQASAAAEAGAQFIVSPGLNPKVVQHCLARGLTVIPGCSNPSDMEQALELGLKTVKFFPAEQAGGLAYLKAVSAPYTDLSFVPTGGIDASNIAGYASFDRVLACGGSWMVNKTLIQAGDFASITQKSREAVDALLGFAIVHIGINTDHTAAQDKDFFAKALGFGNREASASFFVGEGIKASVPLELMKNLGRGTHGHLAIGVNNAERARFHLESRGLEFDDSSATFNDKGKLKFIYMKGEIAGFAVHLLQKS